MSSKVTRVALVKCFACLRDVEAKVKIIAAKPTECPTEVLLGQKCSRCKSCLDACGVIEVLPESRPIERVN